MRGRRNRWARSPLVDASGAPATVSGVLPYNIDHVAIAVRDLEEAVERHMQLYGVEPLSTEVVESQGVIEAMIPIGGSYVQLIQPLGPETPVGRFIERRGEGLHHLAFAVSDIDDALRSLAEAGAVLVDEEPRTGGRGARIAFVHPRTMAGTLVELVELP